MQPGTEPDVRVGPAADVEVVRAGERGRVAVGGAEQCGDLAARRHRRRPRARRPPSRSARTAAAASRSGSSPRSRSRRRPARRAARAPGPAGLGVREQRHHPVAERVDRRLVARVEQQDRRRHQLVAGQPLPVVLGRDQVADQVVAGLAPPARRRAPSCTPRTRPPPSTARPVRCRARAVLVHRDDAGRPRPQQVPVRLGYAEQLGDHGNRQRLGVVGEQVERRAGSTASSSASARTCTRGRSRSTCPRANADATSDRSRVCAGGSFSIIWLRCRSLNGSKSAAGFLSCHSRPNRRSRSSAVRGGVGEREPLTGRLVPDQRRRLAQPRQRRVGVVEERRGRSGRGRRGRAAADVTASP